MKKLLLLILILLCVVDGFSSGNKDNEKLDSIINKSQVDSWQNLPINEIIINVAKEFLGTPYVGGTLEGSPESCKLDLSGLDCVTFYENSLAIARMIKKGTTSLSDLYKELTYIRYRNGILSDYSSRLHYTSDYFYDNIQKSVWKDITKEIGGIKYDKKINFMSTHPEYYEALKNDTKMVKRISDIENEINSREMYYIPKAKVAAIEQQIKSGDIIGITSSVDGLDYNHTGLAYRDEKGNMRFLHASSTVKKVMIDVRLSEYLQTVKKHTGISVMRLK